MRIRHFVHKAVRRLFEDGDPKGLPPETVDKVRKMLAFLQDMGDAGELRDIPVWKAHRLTGDRKGTWSLHVTRSWRLTFRVEGDGIADVDFEDYH
ncbi:MAG: type II toxin-antitoxin system RelE/ParE family toxin [Vicinamibacteraceae bacterium]